MLFYKGLLGVIGLMLFAAGIVDVRKNYEQMIECLCSNLDVNAFVVTEVEDARRVPAEELRRVFQKYTKKKVVCEADVCEALRAAEAQRTADGDVYCLGSLYLAGMVKTAMRQKKFGI